MLFASARRGLLALAAAAIGIAALEPATVIAQTSDVRPEPDKPAAAAPPSVACNALSDPQLAAGITEAESVLHRLWLKTPTSLFVGYRMEAPKRNPFDLSPKAPADEAPISGTIQTKLPRCSAQVFPDQGLLVRFTSPFYRFHDPATGWSRPLRDGLVMEVAVQRAGDAWKGRDTRTEAGIVLHDESVRKPSETELPKLTRWAEPVPKCARRERWDGDDCVRRRR